MIMDVDIALLVITVLLIVLAFIREDSIQTSRRVPCGRYRFFTMLDTACGANQPHRDKGNIGGMCSDYSCFRPKENK